MFWKLLATEFSLSQYHLCIPSFSFAYLFSTSKTSKASSCGFGVYKTVKTIFMMVLSSRLVGDKDEMQWMQFLECGLNEIGVRREVKRAWIVNKCVKRTKQKLRCKMDGIFLGKIKLSRKKESERERSPCDMNGLYALVFPFLVVFCWCCQASNHNE